MRFNLVQAVQLAALLVWGAGSAEGAVLWQRTLRAPALALQDGTTPSLDLSRCDRALVYLAIDRLEAELLDLALEFSPTAGAAWYQAFPVPQREPGRSLYVVDPVGAHLRARWRLVGPGGAIFGLTVECLSRSTLNGLNDLNLLNDSGDG